MSKKALVVLAPGFEEVEAITPIDILRRAEIDVTVAGLESPTVKAAHAVEFTADTTLSACLDSDYDAIVLPGGMPGTLHLLESAELIDLIQRHFRLGKLCCAICAAPRVLDKAGILEEAQFTCYPSAQADIGSGSYTEKPVVYSDTIITSRGVGTALDFALAIVKKLTTEETALKIAQSVIFQGSL